MILVAQVALVSSAMAIGAYIGYRLHRAVYERN